MLRYLKKGFKTTASQYFLLIVLWIYQFAWGLLLLLFVKSIVLPLLHRFPSGHLSDSAVQLFMAEGQFQLMKTDISHSYLWTLLALVVVRMALTPLMNAGIFYSIHNTHLNAGYRFFKGMKELGGKFTFYYLLQITLTAAPLYWLYPIVQRALGTQTSYEALALALLPWAIGYIAFGYLIHLSFLYVMLGRITQAPPLETFSIFLRRFPIVLMLAALILLLSGVLTAVTISASLVWAGISALALHQAFHVIKMLFKLWAVSTQYHHFTENNIR